MTPYQQGYQDARSGKAHMQLLGPVPLDWTKHKAEEYEAGYDDGVEDAKLDLTNREE